MFYERSDDRSKPGHAELKRVAGKSFDVGDVLVMPKGTIHSVWNETSATAVSMHIYGGRGDHTACSQFVAAKQTETAATW